MTGFGAQRKHMPLSNIRSRLEERTFALRLSDGKVCPGTVIQLGFGLPTFTDSLAGQGA
jgi:hypothetical protein